MENLDKVIKRVIGISEDADKLTPMDKGECKLIAEEWVAMQVKNLTIPRVINWVAVKDELPNKGDEVLTITEDGWYRVMIFGSTGRRFPSQVTHWQNLPEPPCL